MAAGASKRSTRAFVLAGLLASSPVALAGESMTAKERAMELYQESAALYQAGELKQAGERLEQAYALDPSPTLLYNLARVHEGLGELEAAIESYRRFLVAAPDTPDRGALEKRIETLGAQLAEQRRLREAEQRKHGKAEEGARGPSAPAVASPAGADPDRAPNRAPWLILGMGGLALGTGAGLGMISRGAARRAEDEESFLEAKAAERRANDFAVAANVALAVGGAVSLAGATWLLARPHRKPRAGVLLSVAPSGAALTARY